MFDKGQDYDDMLPVYKEVEKIAADLIESALSDSDIHIHQIAHRIKERGSAVEKLERKSAKYRSVLELTDIVGFRIICYFAGQVNALADLIEKVFDVDRANSTDKRLAIAPTVFGYISLHYVCSLPKGKGYSDKLCNIKFEIQMRSILQHAWAEIEHDLGYKTEFAIPRELRREFSRVAGLLEVADECFDNIRTGVSEYEAKAHNDIKNDTAAEMTLDLVTLKALISYGRKMQEFNKRIAGISGSKIIEVNPEEYITRLSLLGVQKIGDLYDMIDEYGSRAYSFAERILSVSELDELVSTVGLFYLCRAKLVYSDYDYDRLKDFYEKSGCDESRAAHRANTIMNLREKFK